MTDIVLAAALHYAVHGWAVFPVLPDVKKSYKCAARSAGRAWGMTRDPAKITADFTYRPNARIGITTGVDSGIVVVETDTVAGHGVDGAAALAQLESQHGALPDTLKAVSPSGSIHRYFRHPGAGIKIKNSASAIGTGIDVRGDGGMVIAPPSVNPDGRRYSWINRNPIAAMPAWLVELTREKPRASPTISQRAVDEIRRPTNGSGSASAGDAYGQAALEYEITALANTSPGSRNHALNRASFSLHQLVAGGELDAGEVVRQLIAAATANGLVDDDGLPSVTATIESGRRAGMQHPRSRPGGA
jgi:putative DNA primase/helicase